MIATEGAVRETSGSLHDCQNVVLTSDHSSHTLRPNRIRLIRTHLIHIRLILILLIHIHLIRQGHQDHHQLRINLRVDQIMQESVQELARALEELRERHLEDGVFPPEDIDVYPPQNDFSQEKTSFVVMRM